MKRVFTQFILKAALILMAIGGVELLDTCLPFSANVAQAAPLIWKQQSPLSVALYVNASVDGHDRTFMLDTGLHKTILAPDAQTKAMVSNGQAWMMSSAGESKPCDLVKLRSLSLDAEKQVDTEAQRCDFGPSSANTLGMSSLNNRVLSLNFSRAEYSVSRKSSRKMTLSLNRSTQGHVKLPVEVAGVKAQALFDTGWSITAVDASIIKAHPSLFQLVPVQGAMSDLTGGTTQVSYYRVSELRIGGVLLRNQIVGSYVFNDSLRSVLGADTRVIIGSNTMVLADWCFDLKHNLWSIELRPQVVAQN